MTCYSFIARQDVQIRRLRECLFFDWTGGQRRYTCSTPVFSSWPQVENTDTVFFCFRAHDTPLTVVHCTRPDQTVSVLSSEATVHCEYTPQGQTANQHFYLEVLRRLRSAVHRKVRDKLIMTTHQRINRFFAKHHNPQMHQPTPCNSPYLAPCDFFTTN